ncbi:DNA ligase 6-like protein isoform X3 [Tanacetum coccineum]|uniref:DNA ligase 6-like protein isoform X3 n=1 Tax=Tanacetum coccineum TaxID=301880 RepID=A0ABQ5D5Q8_9ASTR
MQFLFKVPSFGGKFKKYVHTGDFRFCDEMRLDRSVWEESVCGREEDGCFEDVGYEEGEVFTSDESESDVHVIGWNVIGGWVCPDGWTYEVKKSKYAVKVKDEFEIHLVSYSEHSNYEELRE